MTKYNSKWKTQWRNQKEADAEQRRLLAVEERTNWIRQHYGVDQFYNPDIKYKVIRRMVRRTARKQHPAPFTRVFDFSKDKAFTEP